VICSSCALHFISGTTKSYFFLGLEILYIFKSNSSKKDQLPECTRCFGTLGKAKTLNWLTGGNPYPSQENLLWRTVFPKNTSFYFAGRSVPYRFSKIMKPEMENRFMSEHLRRNIQKELSMLFYSPDLVDYLSFSWSLERSASSKRARLLLEWLARLPKSFLFWWPQTIQNKTEIGKSEIQISILARLK
jgi:hypothetical protein